MKDLKGFATAPQMELSVFEITVEGGPPLHTHVHEHESSCCWADAG
jgi:hypothetical protein